MTYPIRLTSIANLLGWTLVALGLGSSTLPAAPISVEIQPVTLNPERPEQLTVGKLLYRGGLVISSSTAEFGGLSALGVSADGDRMVALTDRGRRFASRLVYDEVGNLAGLRRTTLDTMANIDGTPLMAKSDSDIESMSPGVEGEIIVAFERRHRIWRYLPGRIKPEPLRHPAELSHLPPNNGIEGLALLNDGRLFAISEGPTGLPTTLAWASGLKNWSTMTYALKGGFRPTGAATLAKGDVLVLERRFTLRDGVAGRIRRINSTDIVPGEHLNPDLVAEFRDPVAVDNFEGIAVRQGPRGETLIYIVSDNNFNPLQRTILMMFELAR